MTDTTPPADDVREALALAIDPNALELDLYPWPLDAADRVLSIFRVRPRGTVTDVEVAWAEHSTGFAWRDEVQRYGEYRAFLAGFEAAREVYNA